MIHVTVFHAEAFSVEKTDHSFLRVDIRDQESQVSFFIEPDEAESLALRLKEMAEKAKQEVVA